jgi:signal transduction histidine kinase
MTVFEGVDSRRTIDEMLNIVETSKGLLEELARLPDEREAVLRTPSVSTALRARLASKLILISLDLDDHASRLYSLATNRSRATQNRTMLLAILLTGSSLAITAANASMATRLLARRMARLQEGAERIAAGDLGHRIGFAGDDELAGLGRSFDAMAARVEASYVSLENEVAERRRTEAQVVVLNRDLERTVLGLNASNRELEAFSYSVSHDLRAPLRAVDGFSRILLEDHAPQLDAEGKRLLDVVRSNARQMGKLIDDLLSFSRIGRQEMARLPVDMAALARSAFDGLGASGDTISFTVGPLPAAEGDSSLMRQVWANLISNALKFTGPKAERFIQIEGRTEANSVVYSVKDNGVGFDMAYSKKLFGVFQRLHSSAEFEGTGVGLALVQRIVHRHGGKVWAEGKVGEGATFSFSLPGPGGSS